jgi:IS5 family transposase
VNERLEFRPLLTDLQERHPQVAEATEAVIADAGYDSRENCAYVLREMDAVAIIKRRRQLKGDEIDQSALCCCTELGTPICPSGHRMVYWGRDGDYLKWRCPAKVGRPRKVCTFIGGCGTPSEYGRVLKVSLWEDPRRWPGLWRESRKFERLYKKRTAVERVNSRLKEHLLLDGLTIRGIYKVRVHVGLGLVVMLAGAWAMAQVDHQQRMRKTVRLVA